MKTGWIIAGALASCGTGVQASSAKVAALSAKVMVTSAVDKAYLTKNAEGSVYDLATAELAVEKGHSSAVHNYGLMLLRDHARLNERMLVLAHERMLVIPVTMTRKDEAKLKSLMAKNGAAFDTAYVQEAVKINAEDVKQGQEELQKTKDPQVRAVVNDFVRTEAKHLRSARALMAQMTKAK